MNKTICVLLLLALLLSACTRTPNETDIPSAVSAVQEEYGDKIILADADFVRTNFGEREYVDEAQVWLSESGDGTEFGFFHLTDLRYTSEMQTAIRAYLVGEKQSVESLAALYPAEELQTRLARFDRAKIGNFGTTVYYFLTDTAVGERLSARFKKG